MKRLIISILVGSILTSCHNVRNEPIFSEIRFINKSVSPAISAILGSDGPDRADAISALFEKGSKKGFPLIETDPLYQGYVFMTLIYLDSTHRHQIGFEICGIYDEPRFMEQKLYRLDSTDIYYNTYMVPDDICFSYRFILTDMVTGEKQTITDPLNTQLIPTGEKRSFSWSVLDLRTSKTDWYTERHIHAGSRLDTFEMRSEIMDNTRNIYVYLPPDYEKTGTKKYPVLYCFDSFIYLNRVEVPNMLNNLIYESKIEPMVAVFIDNPTSESRKYELPLNTRFKDFMVSELVPHIRNKYRITHKPEQTILAGMSYGGLAAAYIAFECDSVFGKFISQSGSFWRDLQLKDANGFEYRGDWLINRFLSEDKKNLKIFLDWGLQENWCLSSGRRMAKALGKKEYDHWFVEFNGWHDWSNSRKTFPEGLLYLIGNK